MGLFRKLSGFLGLSREEGHEVRGVEDNNNGNIAPSSVDVAAAAATAQAQNVPRRGFSVPIQVPVERAQLGPILVRCSSRDGGVQVNNRRYYNLTSILLIVCKICLIVFLDINLYVLSKQIHFIRILECCLIAVN